MKSPTPVFFKKMRNTGLALAAGGAAIIAAPVMVPALLIQLGSYAILTGGIMSAISQTAIKNETQ